MHEAAKLADVCVVPICYQSTADLMPAVKTILTLEKLNDNIVVLINNTPQPEAEQLKVELSKRFAQHNIFIINRSRYIARLADEGKTLFDLFSL